MGHRDGEGEGSVQSTCLSCGVSVGELHEPFCNKELCPFCGDFITTCECIFAVLLLSAEEREVVEAYEDDSVEPLRGICVRWREAVESKGRVPYGVESGLSRRLSRCTCLPHNRAVFRYPEKALDLSTDRYRRADFWLNRGAERDQMMHGSQ